MNKENIRRHINHTRELSELKSDRLKFNSLDNIEVLPLHEANIKASFENQDNKLCIVYCVWSLRSYIKFLYFSLLSQILYTDITKYDIRIFAAENIHWFVVELLRYLIPEEKIIKTPGGMGFKYGITTHYELQKYEVVSFCDTDAFIFSDTKSVYTKLYEYHTKNPNKVLMCRDNYSASRIFSSRFKYLGRYSDITEEEYLNFFKSHTDSKGKMRIDNFLESSIWSLSCHFSYSNNIFTNYNDFSQLSIDSLYRQFACDETVWLMYLVSRGYTVETIDRDNSYTWVGAELFDRFLTNNPLLEEDAFIHPSTGRYCNNQNIKKIYTKILNDTKQKIRENENNL